MTSKLMCSTTEPRTRVAIAGLGAIGLELVRAFDRGIEGYELTAISARDVRSARERISFARNEIHICAIDALEAHADLVIECAPAKLLPEVIGPFLRAGKVAVVLSCGALLEFEDLAELARAHGGTIVVPSGALLGLDAVNSAAQGTIDSVTMVTRKPVKGLLGAPFLEEKNIDVADITEPLCIFEGSAREAAAGFPANLNVAVALSLAGIGPDRTRLEIWADPDLKRNTHTIKVKADSADFEMKIENIPSENPKTGRITALSVVSALRKMKAPLRVGG